MMQTVEIPHTLHQMSPPFKCRDFKQAVEKVTSLTIQIGTMELERPSNYFF